MTTLLLAFLSGGIVGGCLVGWLSNVPTLSEGRATHPPMPADRGGS